MQTGQPTGMQHQILPRGDSVLEADVRGTARSPESIVDASSVLVSQVSCMHGAGTCVFAGAHFRPLT